jgi:hypothetical protein
MILTKPSLFQDLRNYNFFSGSDVTFHTGLAMCQNISAQMVFINDENENNFIKNNYSTNPKKTIWLAIYDYFQNETNVNYYTNESLNYTDWASKNPDKINEQCISIENDNNWKDRKCDEKHSVLCEYIEITSTTTTISSIITTTLESDSSTTIQEIAFWSSWSSWSFCELYRQRNNSNGIEYQVLNVSCSLVCKFYLINDSFVSTFINILFKTHLLKFKKYQ